jgi:hypothetical protein
MRVPAQVVKALALLPRNFVGTIVLNCNALTRSWAIEITSKEQVKNPEEAELVDLRDLLIPRTALPTGARLAHREEMKE